MNHASCLWPLGHFGIWEGSVMPKHSKAKLGRRQFLKRTAGMALGASVFPYIVPGSALGLNGAVAPSIGLRWDVSV